MQNLILNNNIESSLLNEAFSEECLFLSAKKAFLGKLNRPRFFEYYSKLGVHLYDLRQRLLKDIYSPLPTREFDLWCISGQKMRHINVPALDDLIVQHSVYSILYREIENKLIFDSYGCRKYKGCLKASDRCQEFLRKSSDDSYYLQLDIRKYYYNIDHQIIKQALIHLTNDPAFVNFISLLFPLNQTAGMHVGTLIAQVMGIVYLNSLDHYIKRVLKCKRYIRYVDDLVIIGESKERCWELKHSIESYLKTNLKLELSKFKVSPIKRGINFVGFKTWKHKRYIRKRSLHVFNRVLKKNKVSSLQSCLAHSLRTSSYSKLKEKIEKKGYKISGCKVTL